MVVDVLMMLVVGGEPGEGSDVLEIVLEFCVDTDERDGTEDSDAFVLLLGMGLDAFTVARVRFLDIHMN